MGLTIPKNADTLRVMEKDTIAFIWIIGGIALMVAELATPGMVIVFLGFSAVVVGVLNYGGILSSQVWSAVLWAAVSLALVLAFRKVALRLFPSERSYQLVEDDVDAIGTVVTVIKRINDRTPEGRINYAGTSWQALSSRGVIEEGKKARLLYRDNISWVVEACGDDEE